MLNYILGNTFTLAAPTENDPHDNTQDWCDCGTGLHYVDVWDPNNPDEKHRIASANPETIMWPNYVPEINWQCDEQSTIGRSRLDGDTKEWYVNLHTETKFPCPPFGKDSGRLAWSTPGKR